MKKITLVLPDDADVSVLSSLFMAATLIQVEVIDEHQEKPVARTKCRPPGMSTTKAIMDHYTPSGEFTGAMATKWITAVGFNPNSYSGALSRCKEIGCIENVGGFRSSRYRFIRPLPDGEK